MAKQNKPAIRFKGFTDAWEQRKLTEFVEFFSGLTYTPNDVQENGTLVLRSSNVSNGEVVDADNVYVNPQVVNSENVKVGDIVVVVRNGSRSLIGKHAQIKAFMPNTVIGAFMTGIRSECPEFTNALLNTSRFEEEIAMNMGATINQITGYMFSKMEFKVPYLDEQKKIGEYFEKLDHLITLHQRKYDKLQVLKKAMLEKMFPKNGSSVPEIRFKGFTDAWEQRKLGEVVERITRKNENLESTLPLTISAQYGLINQNEFFDKRIASKDVSGYYLVRNGEFAYNKSTSSDAPWGAIKRLDSYESGVLSTLYIVFKILDERKTSSDYIVTYYNTDLWHKGIQAIAAEGARNHGLLNVAPADFFETNLTMPKDYAEQQQIGSFFQQLDHLITLHQRKPYSHIQRRCNMLNEAQRTDKFCEYYAKWITVYKKGAIRQVTMDKYLMTQKWLEKLIPDLKICDLNRIAYQQLLNDYAEYHERQTTMDFHHQLKGAVLDAVDEGLIDRDPTRKAIIKGKAPSTKKIKYLNQFELHTLLASLELKDEVNWDYFILLVAKTGMRFSEALALTPKDFDFYHQTLSISKTWDYKGAGGFQPTKNKSSVRKIQIDWQSVIRFSELVKGLPDDQPIFVDGKVYNSTVNDVLSRHCERCNIPVISIHGLRHTHASLLLFTGVSIASVARRLGHSSMTTTQKTYLHIIQELENKDIDLVMRSLSGLN